MSKDKAAIRKLSDTEFGIKCKNVGKETYIFAELGLEVFDSKGKKRIGKNGRVKIQLTERVVSGNKEYRVKEITDTHVILKRI